MIINDGKTSSWNIAGESGRENRKDCEREKKDDESVKGEDNYSREE